MFQRCFWPVQPAHEGQTCGQMSSPLLECFSLSLRYELYGCLSLLPAKRSNFPCQSSPDRWWIQRLRQWQRVHGWRVSHGVRVCHHRGPCGGPWPERRGIFGGGRAGQLLTSFLVSGLHGPRPAETIQIIAGFGQMKLHFSSSVANSPLFLHSWTTDHATKTRRFLWPESSVATCLRFCFPKEHWVPEDRLLSFSSLWGPCLFQREFLLKSFVPRDFFSYRHLLLCCKIKGISRCEGSFFPSTPLKIK